MDTVDRFMAVGIVGALMVLISFIVYALVPSSVFIGTFVIGVVLLTAGYFLVRREHRAACSLSEAESPRTGNKDDPAAEEHRRCLH